MNLPSSWVISATERPFFPKDYLKLLCKDSRILRTVFRHRFWKDLLGFAFGSPGCSGWEIVGFRILREIRRAAMRLRSGILSCLKNC